MAFNPTKNTLGADLLTNPTATDRDPWQEAFKRFSSVPESKVLRASESLEGMTGSWAAQYKIGPFVTDNSGQPETTSPSDFTMKANKLGRPGMPEIDFVPYSHNTNRFGNKGGALLGEPISFSVVGPTAKVGGHKMVWQWVVDYDNLVADHYVIYLDSIVVDTTAGPPWSTAARTLDVEDYYNIASGDVGIRFDGGLYLTIQETGYTAEIDPASPVTGGIGDGAAIDDGGATVRVPIQPLTSNSKTELFRIVDLYESGGEVLGFVLDSNKALSDYFTITTVPGEVPILRHLMLIEPAATRLVAIPDSGSGRGQEQVFAFTPPRRALVSENQMLASDWGASAPPWPTEYPWEVAQVSANSMFFYNYGPQLPIQKPYAEWTATLSNSAGFATPGAFGSMFIEWDADTSSGEPLPEVGDIIKIFSIQTDDAALWETANGRSADWGSVLGYFEVTGVVSGGGTAYTLTLRRYAEVSPESGNSMWGIQQLFAAVPVTTLPELRCSIHKPVKELWDNQWFDSDLLDSTRLTNLLDPRWVERTGVPSSIDLAKLPLGKSAFRPDRAIFDTTSSDDGASGSNADPGNLQNLGFRVVLFPARIKTVPVYGGGTEDILTPDWNRPITSNEVTIDPTVNAKQYIEVDYANGLVRLSHPPQAVDVTDPNAGDLAPLEDIFTLGTDDNPRGEMVLFAACVPYTQDNGQLGAGPRITASAASSPSADACVGNIGTSVSGEFCDVYGQRVAFDVDTTAAQTITCRNLVGNTDQQLTLTGLLADQLPPTGFFELFQSGDPVLTTGRVRGSLFGYYGVVETGGNTVLHGVHGGLEADTDTVTINIANPAQIVLRRELYTPNDLYGTASVLYQNDVTYGDSKRAGTIRFTGINTSVNLDGSVTVEIQNDLAEGVVENMGDMFSSWLLSGGVLTGYYDAGGPTYGVNISETTIIYQGRRVVIPAGFLATAAAGSTYIYVDGSDCSYQFSSTIPLSDPEYVLLGYYAGTPGQAPDTFDLRYPLLDIDRRLDIFVGNRLDGTGVPLTGPHFTTLTAAVNYANQILNPTDPSDVSAGYPDFRVRIRVVGYTLENAASLPITIATDGLTIESDPSAETTSAITWDADDLCLIDLNGHDNLTFEGVNFRSISTDTANTEPLRALFTNTGGIVSNLKINNCRLEGSQGFMAMVGNRIEDSTVTNNTGIDLMDFGIYLTNELIDPMTIANGITADIVVSSGYLLVIKGPDVLTITSAADGGITYSTAAGGTTTIDDGNGNTIVLNGDEETARLEAHGEALIDHPANPDLTVSDDDVGSIYQNSVNGSVWVVSRVLERCTIENNTFTQADTIGNMADNALSLGVAAATITTTAGFTLRIGNDDPAYTGVAGTDYVDIPAGTSTWVINNNGAAAQIHDSGGLSLDISLPTDMTTAAFYAVTGSTGSATIQIPGEDPIVVTADTWGYMSYDTGVLYFTHGPNTGAVAGGIVAYTYYELNPADYDTLFNSLTVNQHNRISNNTLNGFHNGIYADILWNSDVRNNYVRSSKNVGIYVGPFAAYNNVDNNALENVFNVSLLDDERFQWPAQISVAPNAGDFGTPAKYGLWLSGLYSKAQSNVVATASYFDLVLGAGMVWESAIYDILLWGSGLEAESNTAMWNIGAVGSTMGIINNTIASKSGEGFNADSSISTQGATYSTIRGNKCGGHIYLNNSGYSVVEGNSGITTVIYASNPELDDDGTRLGSPHCSISDNKVYGIDLNGTANAANRPFFCTLQGNTCTIINNGDTTLSTGPTNTRIIGNAVATDIVSQPEATYAIISSNTVSGTIDINADECVVSNNFATVIDVNGGAGDIRKIILMGNNAPTIQSTGSTPAKTPTNTVAVGNIVSGDAYFGQNPIGIHNNYEGHNVKV